MKIVVLDQDVRGSTIRRHEFPPTLVTPIATLLVHRRVDHFNGLVPSTNPPASSRLPSAVDQSQRTSRRLPLAVYHPQRASSRLPPIIDHLKKASSPLPPAADQPSGLQLADCSRPHVITHSRLHVITYSASELCSIQACALLRSTRKAISKLNLWKPSVKTPFFHGSGVQPSNLIRVRRTKFTQSKSVKVALLNCRSAQNKCAELREHVIDNELDIFALTETWLRKNDTMDVSDLCPDGYSFINCPRSSGKGGGIGIIHRSRYILKPANVNKDCKFKTFEYTAVRMKGEKSCCLVVVYRPPPSKANGLTEGQFFAEFDEFLSELSVIPFHVDQADKAGVRTFMQQLATANLQQHVSQSTHKFGHTLDLVMTRKREQCVKSITVKNDMLSGSTPLILICAFHQKLLNPVSKQFGKSNR